MFDKFSSKTWLRLIIIGFIFLIVTIAISIAVIMNKLHSLSITGMVSESLPFLQRFIIMQSFITAFLIVFLILSVKLMYSNMMYEEAEKATTIFMQYKEVENQAKELNNLMSLYDKTIRHPNFNFEIFSNICHEIKTPISIILGAIQLMEQKRNTISSERRTSLKHLKTIKQNCYRLLRLVNNILDITKMDSGYIKTNFQNYNIVYLIEEMAQSVIPYAQNKNLYIEFDTEAEEIITAVDVDKIERIILNLLSNSIKFTPPSGKICVSISKRNDKALISVKDTGAGIPPDMQKIIFERYRHAENFLTSNNEGTGIGLSIVKSFVELHDGVIKVNSEFNKGSEFIIELPIRLCETAIDAPQRTNNSQTKIIEAINIEFSDIYSFAS